MSDVSTMKPVSKATNLAGKPVEKQMQAGYEAQAFALVQSCIAIAKDHGNEWLRIVARLYDGTTDLRKAFRAGLEQHKKEMQAHVVESGKDPIYVGAKSSAIVRFSQLKRISMAMDAGYAPAVKIEGKQVMRRPSDNTVILTDPFDTIVAQARVYLASHGEGSTQGRKALTFPEKLKKYIEAHCESKDDLLAAEKIVHQMAKAFKADTK